MTAQFIKQTYGAIVAQDGIAKTLDLATWVLFRAVADDLLAAISAWEDADDQSDGRSKADHNLIDAARTARERILRLTDVGRVGVAPVPPVEEWDDDKLKPCPFCGSEAERIDDPAEEDDDRFDAGGSCIQCTQCTASSALHFDRKENLVRSWNDRAITPAYEEELSARDLALIDQAWESHKVAVPVARVINDNQPGRTAIIEILAEPPTLVVGALLYAEPKSATAGEA